jgi:hypothetical protein
MLDTERQVKIIFNVMCHQTWWLRQILVWSDWATVQWYSKHNYYPGHCASPFVLQTQHFMMDSARTTVMFTATHNCQKPKPNLSWQVMGALIDQKAVSLTRHKTKCHNCHLWCRGFTEITQWILENCQLRGLQAIQCWWIGIFWTRMSYITFVSMEEKSASGFKSSQDCQLSYSASGWLRCTWFYIKALISIIQFWKF